MVKKAETKNVASNIQPNTSKAGNVENNEGGEFASSLGNVEEGKDVRN
jgi:hypothetical protein